MVRDGVVKALELVAPLLGVGLFILGMFSLNLTHIVGIPLLIDGLLLTLRPPITTEPLDIDSCLF